MNERHLLPLTGLKFESHQGEEDIRYPLDAELVAIVEDIQDELPCYGYRRVTHELHGRGHLVNRKRVARVMRANELGTACSENRSL
jgi:hypothetical protein